MGLIITGSVAWDFRIYAEALPRMLEGRLYDVTETYAWPYSPVAAVVLGALTAVGVDAWRLTQVALAAALPTWPMRAATLISWPFWVDMQHASVMTLSLFLAAWSLQGRRWAQAGYVLVCVLVPRPLYLPLLIWLLWRWPWTRRVFVPLALAHGLALLASGLGDDWIATVGASSLSFDSAWNLAPSRFIGTAWIPIGLIMAAYLLAHGRIGLASLAAAPYALPYYLLFSLLDLIPGRAGRRMANKSGVATSFSAPRS